jgi:hypothetical protein
MSQARVLSSDDVRGLRAELAAGRTPTVWFTPAAVGVPEGRSGKVIALDDPAEGDFIQIRPAGSKDVLSFSAGEVTVVRPPRKRKETEAAATPAARGSAPSEAAPPSASAAAAVTAKQPGRATSAASGARKPPETARATSGSDDADVAARRKPRQPPSAATLTLTAGQDGQWSVEVTSGKKRLLRPISVPASAVAQAAKALHSEVAEAVEPVIEAAREQQRSRVERLKRELADAERMLDDLSE